MLYLVTDDPLDARRRLVTVVDLAVADAVDVLYRYGPGRFGKVDGIIVDTPPVKKGGCLPGVLLIAPTDGDDASANLIRMLRATPANTDVVLVRIDAVPRKEWERDATTIHDASNHAGGSYLRSPLPRTDEVRNAPNRGQSCTLPRRWPTREFIQGIESLAGVAWGRIRPGTTLPLLAASAAPAVHIPGWDDGASSGPRPRRGRCGGAAWGGDALGGGAGGLGGGERGHGGAGGGRAHG